MHFMSMTGAPYMLNGAYPRDTQVHFIASQDYYLKIWGDFAFFNA